MKNNFQVNNIAPREIANQTKLIVKSFALAALKPRLYNAPIISDDEFDALTTGDLNRGYSDFGLPTFDILTFNQLNYTSLDNKSISINQLDLGIALIDINQSKNIVTTAIQGRNGTIKEYVSDGDYIMNIKGVLVGFGQDVYPEDDVRQLRDFLNAPVSIQVSSTILNRWNITDIVVSNFTIRQEEGQRNVVPFEINALSETPFEIKKKVQ